MKTESFGSPLLAFDNFDADLFGQLLNAEVAKGSSEQLGSTGSSISEESTAFDLSQFVNDDSVHQLATPALIQDDLPFAVSPFDISPASGHLDYSSFLPGGDFSSLFPSVPSLDQSQYDPALIAQPAFNVDPTLDVKTCSPQELGLSSPIDSPPFGMLPSPAPVPAVLPAQEQEEEISRGRGKRKRKETQGKFTGFRNSSTPPVPIDAPIASRNYVLPSATSRKEVPVLMQRQIKKRKTGKSDTSVDSAEGSPIVSGTGELDKELVDAIAQKRLQNTVAARRSRQRKQEELQRLKDERDEWKARAEEAEAKLRAAGLL